MASATTMVRCGFCHHPTQSKHVVWRRPACYQCSKMHANGSQGSSAPPLHRQHALPPVPPFPLSSQPSTIVCYYCHVPGHGTNHCPGLLAKQLQLQNGERGNSRGIAGHAIRGRSFQASDRGERGGPAPHGAEAGRGRTRGARWGGRGGRGGRGGGHGDRAEGGESEADPEAGRQAQNGGERGRGGKRKGHKSKRNKSRKGTDDEPAQSTESEAEAQLQSLGSERDADRDDDSRQPDVVIVCDEDADETPVSETPVSETPVSETSVSETPVSETPLLPVDGQPVFIDLLGVGGLAMEPDEPPKPDLLMSFDADALPADDADGPVRLPAPLVPVPPSVWDAKARAGSVRGDGSDVARSTGAARNDNGGAALLNHPQDGDRETLQPRPLGAGEAADKVLVGQEDAVMLVDVGVGEQQQTEVAVDADVTESPRRSQNVADLVRVGAGRPPLPPRRRADGADRDDEGVLSQGVGESVPVPSPPPEGVVFEVSPSSPTPGTSADEQALEAVRDSVRGVDAEVLPGPLQDVVDDDVQLPPSADDEELEAVRDSDHGVDTEVLTDSLHEGDDDVQLLSSTSATDDSAQPLDLQDGVEAAAEEVPSLTSVEATADSVQSLDLQDGVEAAAEEVPSLTSVEATDDSVQPLDLQDGVEAATDEVLSIACVEATDEPTQPLDRQSDVKPVAGAVLPPTSAETTDDSAQLVDLQDGVTAPTERVLPPSDVLLSPWLVDCADLDVVFQHRRHDFHVVVPPPSRFAPALPPSPADSGNEDEEPTSASPVCVTDKSVRPPRPESCVDELVLPPSPADSVDEKPLLVRAVTKADGAGSTAPVAPGGCDRRRGPSLASILFARAGFGRRNSE